MLVRIHACLVWNISFGMLCFVVVLGLPPRGQDEAKISDTITQLSERIQSLQIKSNSTVVIPPLFWNKLKGLYPSYIKLNFHGKPEMAFMREKMNMYDNNMFISAWITLAILEAYSYGGGPKPGEKQIQMMLNTISEFYDHNRYNGSSTRSSIKTFWPQVLNSTTNTWESNPVNTFALLNIANSMPLRKIQDILKDLGLTELELFLEIARLATGPIRNVILIPPDADDTFINLGLGALLTDLSAAFPNEQKTWLSQNKNKEDVFDKLVRYSYRPFSKDINAKCIDPRTYYYARTFLEEARSKGEDIALATTQLQNIDETRYMPDRGVHMSFNVNTVNVAVCSNVIYGITSAVLTGLVDVSILDRPGLMQVYANTSSFVAWQMATDFHQRPDLSMPFYPSMFEVYWFASRTLALLERKAKVKPLPQPVFEEVRQRFRASLRGHVGVVIVSKAKHESSDMVYFDDFLGDGDTSIFGKPEIRGEDRIFTTAMAVNVLLNSWAVFYQGKMHWDKGPKVTVVTSDYIWHNLLMKSIAKDISRFINNTEYSRDAPADVRLTVLKAVTWLNRYSVDSQFKPMNAFFSVTTKGRQTMPYRYPINFLQYLNGTDIPLNTTRIPEHAVLAMCGTVQETVYQTMLNQTHFGTPGTPRVFGGYNADGVLFNFWSSKAYTYSISLLALAQFRNLERTESSDDTLRWRTNLDSTHL